jgi:RNA polymerase sigma-70 factor, ECF subfamily
MSEERPREGTNQPEELETLMRRYQQSDSEAAANLVSQLSSRMYRFYLACVRERTLAEDLLQEFWLRIHSARRTYRPGEPVLPWMYAIARRVRIDHYRHHRKSNEHEIQSEPLPQIAASDPPLGSSLALADLLETLPAAQREVILLLKVSGLTLEEVARATGTSAGAVKQKAHRAYEKLRQLFGRET